MWEESHADEIHLLPALPKEWPTGSVKAVSPYSRKALTGELRGYYSHRLSYKDRIIYSINNDELIVLGIRAKTHYSD